MEELLTRGVEQIIGQDELEAAIKAKRKLRVKFGVDPTRPDIHIGHSVVLRQLRQLQDMGHTIIFLIGDYTTKIGDPSGKNKTRPTLDDKEIEANAQTYLDQVGKILDVKKAEIRRNSEWLAKLSFADLINLASQVSVAQLIERDDFKNRLEAGQELALHELLYPLMQAYDSVMLEADVEFGGSDQLFNLLAGRSLQKKLGQKPQVVWTSKLLVGTDGSRKMSKSYDNYVAITDAPVDMYGKVMSVPDSLIAPYYELCTDVPMEAISGLVRSLAEGANPRDSKASLAREIVRLYHGEPAALKAEESWNSTFRDKGKPSDDQIEWMDYNNLNLKDRTIIEFLLVLNEKNTSSKNQVRTLISQKGVKINDKVVESETEEVKPGDLVSVGRHNFYGLKK